MSNRGRSGFDDADIEPHMLRQLEYQARRAMRRSSAAIDATRSGTPGGKSSEWRRGQSPSSCDR